MDHLDLMEYKPDINVKSNRVTKSPSFFEQLMEADICPDITCPGDNCNLLIYSLATSSTFSYKDWS